MKFLWLTYFVTLTIGSIYLCGVAFASHHYILGLWNMIIGIIFIAEFYYSFTGKEIR